MDKLEGSTVREVIDFLNSCNPADKVLVRPSGNFDMGIKSPISKAFFMKSDGEIVIEID